MKLPLPRLFLHRVLLSAISLISLIRTIIISQLHLLQPLISISKPTTPKATAQKPSLLPTLPPELIQHIANYLPLESRLVLAFTCKALYFNLPVPTLLTHLNHDPQGAKARLLFLLLRHHFHQHPGFICDRCAKIYRWPNSNESSAVQCEHYMLTHAPRFVPRRLRLLFRDPTRRKVPAFGCERCEKVWRWRGIGDVRFVQCEHYMLTYAPAVIGLLPMKRPREMGSRDGMAEEYVQGYTHRDECPRGM